MGATIKIPAEFRAIDNFSQVVKRMTAGVRNFSTSGIAAIKRFDHSINTTFSKLGNISKLAIGLSIGTIFSMAVRGNLEYNESLQSLYAITGAAGKDMGILEGRVLDVAKATKKSGAEVAKAFELVGSAKPELLKNVDALDKTTRAVITLSKASKMDLETSALSLTNVMNQFNLGAAHSNRTINALAAGAKEGAAAIPLISDAILQFGTGARAFNVSLEESVGLVETFAAKGLKGAEAGTKLRNILTKMSAINALPKEAIEQLKKFGVNTSIVSDATIPFRERLKELSKIAGNSTAMVKVFGLENKEAGSILLNNIPMFDNLTKAVTGSSEAHIQAGINSSSFAEKLKNIKNSFLNTTTATNSNNGAMLAIGKTMDFVSNNMEAVVGIGAGLVGLFGTLKAMVWGSQAALVAYNVVLGIQGALSGAASIAIGQNAIALGAYKTIMAVTTAGTWLATAATTAFGVALNLGLWPITAIIAAIAAVVAIFYYWDDITAWFGKQWKAFTGMLGAVWDNLVKWFKNFSFKDFFKNIGQSLMKYLLWPMKGLLTMLSKLPGKVGKMASMGLDKIGEMSGELDVNDSRKPLDGPEVRAEQSRQATRDAMVRGSIDLNIRDKGNNVESAKSNGPVAIPIRVTNTQGVN